MIKLELEQTRTANRGRLYLYDNDRDSYTTEDRCFHNNFNVSLIRTLDNYVGAVLMTIVIYCCGIQFYILELTVIY